VVEAKGGEAKLCKGEGRRTISKTTSPAVNESPTCFFQAAMPPSVIVGDMAGNVYLEKASRRAEVARPVGKADRSGLAPPC